jgi:nicotinate-nucleotide adenylyltransferase
MRPISGPPDRLGVMGGTFDPIHVGHLIAATEALHALSLDLVLFVPAGRPWQKATYAPAEDRYLMTVLAAGSHERFAVSRLELDRDGPTYTVDTMEQLKSFYGVDVHLFFIVGSDALANFGTWHRVGRLKNIMDLVAVSRPESDTTLLPRDPSWPPITYLEIPEVGISSTDVRDRVRTGRPIDYLVPDEVEDYIRRNGLYLEQQEIRGA